MFKLVNANLFSFGKIQESVDPQAARKGKKGKKTKEGMQAQKKKAKKAKEGYRGAEMAGAMRAEAVVRPKHRNLHK